MEEPWWNPSFHITERKVHTPNLEVAAGTGLAEPGDTVQVVGGHSLVLLFQEPEGGEWEAGVVAVSVLKHRRHLVLRTPVWCWENTAGLMLVLNGSTRWDLCVFFFLNQAGVEGIYGTKRLKKVELFGEEDMEA